MKNFHHFTLALQYFLAACILAVPAWAVAQNQVPVNTLVQPFAERPVVQAYIDQLVRQDGFKRARLLQIFSQVKPLPAVIQAIERPAESLPWYHYRSIFMTPARIAGGVAFWQAHRATLERAERVYGVPPQIVTAIIGVETLYGERMGNWQVMDALATLGFDYPPRAHYFRSQLTQFLLLARTEGFNPLLPKGSYAGAMGMGQFMPGSYRHYAVDFDHNGRRDLWSNTNDAIGSVANYLARHGWQRGGMVAIRATIEGTPPVTDKPKFKPGLTPAQLAALHVQSRTRLITSSGSFSLIRLEGRQHPQYWVGAKNFYAIMRYNYSPLYAMVVYQLSMAICKAHHQTCTGETLAPGKP